MKSVACEETDAEEEKRRARPIDDPRIGRLSERLKAATEGQSLRAVADRSGVSEGTLRNLLAGGVPKLDNILRIADATGVSAAWLAAAQGPMREGEQPAPGALDMEALIMAIETVEEGLAIVRGTMNPKKKAAVVASCYELFTSDGGADQGAVLRLVTSAA